MREHMTPSLVLYSTTIRSVADFKSLLTIILHKLYLQKPRYRYLDHWAAGGVEPS
jgi:hypothetical protein